MENNSSTRGCKTKAFSTAGVLVLVGGADLILYVGGILATRKLSPWIVAVVVNMIFGGVFAVGYIFVRNGPAVFCISSRVFAFVWIVLGNFAVVWYMAYMIAMEGDVVAGVLPYSDGRLDSVVPMRTERERKKSELIRVFAWLAVVAMGFSCVRAALKESLAEGWKTMARSAWASWMAADCATGVVMVAVYMAAREGASVVGVAWLAALLLLGNMATFAYLAAMASRALATDAPFSHVMLSTSRAQRDCAT
ncbi:unnamed protein product [Agarophyton chilense]